MLRRRSSSSVLPCAMPKRSWPPARTASACTSAQRVVSSTARSSSRRGASAGGQTSRHIAMSDPSRRWISTTPSGVKRSSAPSYTERKVTPSSSSARIVSRSEKTWKPPESVRIGPSQPEKACSPPRPSMTSAPGRKCRWYVFASTTLAPSALTSSGWSVFTVAFVPTGMKAGVGMSPCAVFTTPVLAAASRAVTVKVLTRGSDDQHRVAEGIEPVSLLDRDAVELERLLDAGEGHDEGEQRRARQVEVREQGVHAAKLESGADEERRPALELTRASNRLHDADRCRPHRQNAFRRGDPRPCIAVDLVPLAVQRVLLETLLGHRPERVQADMERDRDVLDPAEQVGREVQPGGRRCGRARVACVHRLVALGIVE